MSQNPSKSIHCNNEAGQNGSVVINGTTYTQSSTVGGGGGSNGNGNGTTHLSNGYLNPDVIPTTSNQISKNESVESVQNRLNSTNASELLHHSDETEIITSAAAQPHPKNRLN